MSALGVVATIKVQPGKEAEFEAIFKELRAKTRSEPGNLQYDFFKSKSEEATYFALEQYASQEAAQAHAQSEHVQAATAALGKVLAARPQLQLLDRIE